MLGMAFLAFTAIIFIGSIHLGWHYAVDSIAGILLAVAFWAAAGVVARVTMRLALLRPSLRPAAALGAAQA